MKFVKKEAAGAVLGIALSGIVSAQVSVQPYGFLKVDAAYDSSRTTPGDISFHVRPKVHGKSDDELTLHARDTRVGLKFAAPAERGILVTGQLEGDFLGGGTANAYTPRLRLGWIDAGLQNGWSVRVGQDWDAFVVQMVKSPDFGLLGQQGALWQRRAQARVTHTLQLVEQQTLTTRVALARTIGEGLTADLDGGGQDDGADTPFPSVQSALIWSGPLWTAKKAQLGVSGHWGRETLDRSEEGKIIEPDTDHYDSWSVIGTFVLPLTSQWTVQGSLWRGENLDSFLGGIGQGINLKLGRAIRARGGWVQALWDVTEHWSLSAGYGVDDPDDADLNQDQRAKNERAFFNAYYKATSQLTFAGELARLQTAYKGCDEAASTRGQLSAILNF